MTSMKYISTGKTRPPLAGEFFKNSRGGIEEARFDFSEIELEIMKMRVIDIPDGNVECQGFLVDDSDPTSHSGCDWGDDCPVCHGDGHHKPIE